MSSYVFKIALASLARRKTRTGLVIIMIGVSLWGLLLMEGLYDGMTEQLINNSLGAVCGHISLLPHNYRQDPDIKKLIYKDKEITARLELDPRIKSCVSRIEQDGLAATAETARNVKIYGIDLPAEEKFSNLAKTLRQGQYDFGSRGRGALIGYKLADKLKTGLGRKVVISAQDREGEVSSLPFKIAGIVKTGNMAVDENGIFIGRKTAARLLDVQGAAVRINLMLSNENDTHLLQQQLAKQYPDLDVWRWDEMYPALMQSRVMMRGFNLVTNFLVFGVAGLGIFGVILVSVIERTREFGIMQAVGTEFSFIRAVVLVESLIIGLAGYLLGSFLGAAGLAWFVANGLDLTRFSAGLDEFGLNTIAYAVIRPQYFITAFTAVVTATVLTVIFPLRVLKRSKPIRAINSL